ncbi:10787_t:CDS:2 [Diversispora eburnea]|uniref:hydroxymethylbilane synthase n=1 Tax=Diversispora eburnea TaxID=1213867 RepID=A0A9N9FLG2_9GLOM|nr:10787_t:CDS:2 [Diversispora eburnea]
MCVEHGRFARPTPFRVVPQEMLFHMVPCNKKKATLFYVRLRRNSELALIQTNHVQNVLQLTYPDFEFPIKSMTTVGDQILNVPLYQIGEKSLFTKELETALQNNQVDLVVHSLKDLPTTLPVGMTIGAILKRENPHDAVVIKQGLNVKSLKELPKGSIIGTSSVRRTAQLKRAFPDLIFQNVRGNLNTRLRKLDDPNGPYSALILAVAGLIRLNQNDRISEILPSSIILHAVGQGALAVECRTNDEEVIKLLSVLEDEDTKLCCTAERSLLRILEGGCSVPIGANTEFIESKNEVARILMKNGASNILQELKNKSINS